MNSTALVLSSFNEIQRCFPYVILIIWITGIVFCPVAVNTVFQKYFKLIVLVFS